MSRAVIAFKPRTGRAVRVVLAVDNDEPSLVERAEVALLPPGEFAPYHAAEGMAPEAARRHVEGSIARAQELAHRAIEDGRKRCEQAGHEVAGCAVLVGNGMPKWTTVEILAVHIRMHQAEGEIFREVLVQAAKACVLAVTTLPDKTVFEAAAKRLRIRRSQLDAKLAALGKSAGPPWGQYQKEAAAAGLVALFEEPSASRTRFKEP